MEGEYNVDYEVMGRASEQLTDDIASLSSMGEYITFNLDGMDSRVSDYLISVYKLNDLADQFNSLSNQTTGYQAWMDDAVGRVKGVDSDLAEIVTNAARTDTLAPVSASPSAGTKPDIQTPDVNLEVGGIDIGTHQGEEHFVDPSEFEKLPENVQKDIRDILKGLGYSDDEIEKILSGQMAIKPEDYENIKDYIDDLRASDPELADQLDLVFGIHNPWAELSDSAKDSVIQFLESLGYNPDEISDIVHGKRQLTDEELEQLMKYISEIEKTDPALAAQLRELFGLNKQNGVNLGTGSNGTGDVSGLDNSNTGIGTTTGSSIGGSLGASGTSNANVAMQAAEALTSASGGLLDKLGNSAKKLASKMSPYNGGETGIGDTSHSSTGIIAAAALAAGGAAAGGGVLAGKKLNYITFTPKDWEVLGIDYQGVIKKIMKRSGLTDDEIETFINSTFKVPANDIKDHVKKIEDAYQKNPNLEDELVKMYNFSMFDDHKRVVYYLLFITMIIDGRNVVDEYNMYNIINQNVEDFDESDFAYTGITLDEYLFNEKIDEEVSVKPTTIQTEEVKVIPDKEWLQGIGLDD